MEAALLEVGEGAGGAATGGGAGIGGGAGVGGAEGVVGVVVRLPAGGPTVFCANAGAASAKSSAAAKIDRITVIVLINRVVQGAWLIAPPYRMV